MSDEKWFEEAVSPVWEVERITPFFHRYNRIREGAAFYPVADLVKRQGYRTAAQQVAELMAAGQALDAQRRFQYQHEGSVPEGSRYANPPHDWDIHDQRQLVADIKQRILDSVKPTPFKDNGDSSAEPGDSESEQAPE